MSKLEKYNPRDERAVEIQDNAKPSWSRVRYWSSMATRLEQGSLAARVMCGFDLLELHKEQGIKPGNPRPETGRGNDQLPNDSVIEKWPDLVKKYAGISDDTARNWMAMAVGVRKSWRKLSPQARLRELMRVSPTAWASDDIKLIGDAVAKATDGVSQVEFMREIGAAKKPVGNTSSNKPGKKPNAPLPPEDVSDPLIEIENDIVSIADEKDLTMGDCNTGRLVKFKTQLERLLSRVDAILKARKK